MGGRGVRLLIVGEADYKIELELFKEKSRNKQSKTNWVVNAVCRPAESF